MTELVTLVGAEGGLTLTALAKAAHVPLATCASIVYTLEQRGYAARTVVGRSHFWRATLGIYGLAAQLVRNVDIPTVSQDELRELAGHIGMPVHIGVLSGASDVPHISRGLSEQDGVSTLVPLGLGVPGCCARRGVTPQDAVARDHLRHLRGNPILSNYRGYA